MTRRPGRDSAAAADPVRRPQQLQQVRRADDRRDDADRQLGGSEDPASDQVARQRDDAAHQRRRHRARPGRDRPPGGRSPVRRRRRTRSVRPTPCARRPVRRRSRISATRLRSTRAPRPSGRVVAHLEQAQLAAEDDQRAAPARSTPAETGRTWCPTASVQRTGQPDRRPRRFVDRGPRQHVLDDRRS